MKGRSARIMTLTSFLTSKQRNAWINHPDFFGLYVRRSTRLIDNSRESCFDVAAIEAVQTNQGAWRSLVEELSTRLPGMILFVECVHNEQFADYLLRTGFQKTAPPGDIWTKNFWKRL